MTTETPTKENDKKTTATPAAKSSDAKAPRSRGGNRSFKKNPRRKPRRTERVKPEFEQKLIGIRRVTRVVAGGRRFSFSVTMVLGNRKGKVGVGVGKAGDTALAIEKAIRDAKKNMITLALTDTGSILHEVDAKYASARVMMYPAPGKGLTAGGAIREVLALAGVKDVGAKVLSRSKNKINNARAAVKALEAFKTKNTPATSVVAKKK